PFGDALQIAVDPDNATADDRLFIFTLSGGHALYTDVNNYSTQYILPTGREISSEVKYAMKTIDGGMAYEIAIPWKLTMSPPPKVGQDVGICVGMQEFDDRYRGWMEWPARVHTTYLVDPNELGQIVLMK
ncbi:MAG: sugar-binding protein, partial [Dehalococcoidia bacterium]|nr:sugar-binding protein [Dehalococcoidia bacterium]